MSKSISRWFPVAPHLIPIRPPLKRWVRLTLTGILITLMLIFTTYTIAKFKANMGPPGPRTSWGVKVRSLKDSWAAILLFCIVMGGIWFGVFTPTEAAAIGAFLAFLLIIINARLNSQSIISCLKNSLKATGMIFLLLIGAMIFGYFIAVSKLPMALATFVAGLDMSPYGVLVVIILIYLVLGCIMDTISMLLLTLPIFFPVIEAIGFDPIWFGVIVTLMIEIALITPPFGVNVFVIAGIAEDSKVEDIFRGIFPFLIALFLAVAILIIFPQLSLFLPGFM